MSLNDKKEALVINHKNGKTYFFVPTDELCYNHEPKIVFKDGLFVDNISYEKYYLLLIRFIVINEYKYPDIDSDDIFNYQDIIDIRLCFLHINVFTPVCATGGSEWF